MVFKILQALLVVAALVAFGLYQRSVNDRPKPGLPADHAIEVQSEVAPAPPPRSSAGSMEFVSKTEAGAVDDGTGFERPPAPPPPVQQALAKPAPKKREVPRLNRREGVGLSDLGR